MLALASAIALSLCLAPDKGFAQVQAGGAQLATSASGQKLAVKAKKKLPSYTVTPKTKPLNEAIMKSDTYTAQTKHWWMLSYIMKEFEKRGGGTLTLKKGTYKLPISVQVPSNVKIVFQKGVKIKKVKKTGSSRISANGPLFQMISPSKYKKNNAVKNYNGTRNVTFEGKGNVVFDMGKLQQGACAIIMAQNQNMKFSGITFTNLYAHAFELDASKNVVIENCTFENGIGGKTNEAINLDIPDPNTKGFGYRWSAKDKTPNQNVTIQNCTFRNVMRGIGTHMYSQADDGTNKMHTDIKILNNTFTGIAGYEGCVVPFNWENVRIEGNTFSGTGQAAKTYGIVAHSVVNAWIADNTFSNLENTILVRRGFNAAKYPAPAEVSLTEEQLEALSTNRYVAGTVADPDAKVTDRTMYYTTDKDRAFYVRMGMQFLELGQVA